MPEKQQQPKLVPVILCGGAGTRLWPLSRELYPKQFLSLTDTQSLFQGTIMRLTGLERLASPVVVTNEDHRFVVAEQLRQLGIKAPRIILEPVGRNTAPAIAVAALDVLARDDEVVLLVLPADHLIQEQAPFHSVIHSGYAAALRGKLVTFGIVPDRPETGYGYVKRGNIVLAGQSGNTVFSVERFVEKPDKAAAQGYLNTNKYLWNSGMFMFTASRYLEVLNSYASHMVGACKQAYNERAVDRDFLRLGREPFSACPSDSIDYAVMERTADAVVIPLQSGWSDVGSWNSLWEVGPHDEMGNYAKGDVVTEDCKACYLHSSGRLLVAVGLRDQVVVETPDAILVAPRARSQAVRRVVQRLKTAGRDEINIPPKVHRPWGWYQSIDIGNRFQVKHLTLNPGQSLTLQLHQHRAEHWIIVHGQARITRGDEILTLTEHESTFVPAGSKHRLENSGEQPLEIIEVQSGGYVGEDDIVRFVDR